MEDAYDVLHQFLSLLYSIIYKISYLRFLLKPSACYHYTIIRILWHKQSHFCARAYIVVASYLSPAFMTGCGKFGLARAFG